MVTAKIVDISNCFLNDIVFHNADSDQYYINRGLDYRLILDSVNVKVLNKTVTLHLSKLFYGTSNHIAQLAIDDEIIFTEFSSL